MIMTNNFLVYQMLFFLYTVHCIPKVRREIEDVRENIRAQKAWQIIRDKTCLELTSSHNCTKLKDRFQHKMTIYLASKNEFGHSQLNIRLVRRKHKDQYTNLDAVVVVDPFPDAMYGHTVVVLLIKNAYTRRQCRNKGGIHYQQPSGRSECMYLPGTMRCRLFTMQNARSLCSFNYIPLVYDSSDALQRSRLRCHSGLEGFGECPPIVTTPTTECPNQLCSTEKARKNKSVCHETCDYAVFLSGGWNKFLNRKRHFDNMLDMWKYLTVKRYFRPNNINVYFANNGSIDLDGNPETKDSVRASKSRITDHIESVCRKSSRCIDTLVIYLNGPTLPNGDMLMWDRNSDGSASASEILTIKELLNPFKKCGAKHFLIIADQNYAGHIIDEVKTGVKLRYKNFGKIHVVSASTKRSWAWDRSFTKKFIEYDNFDSGTSSRKISDIVKDLRKTLSRTYKIRYYAGDNSDLTITGDYNQVPGCKSAKRNMVGT